jgi:putative iron-dependent peroxidase
MSKTVRVSARASVKTNLPGKPQAGILAEAPALGRYLFFTLPPETQHQDALKEALQRLGDHADGTSVVVGIGQSLVQRLGVTIPGLRAFPAIPLLGSGKRAAHNLPADNTALWCWLRSTEGEDTGHLLHRSRRIAAWLTPAFKLQRVVDGFCHAKAPVQNEEGHGHDLTGYEDGTENPKGKAARTAALVNGLGPGMDGSSFVAVQQWQHNFKAFDRLSGLERDHTIGRRQSDNEELDDAPASAHVKRTAQESFTPEAFVLRRSMPWVDGQNAGLMFVAFGHTLDAFEAQMRRMAGQDDGVVDALFGISKPLTGAYFWCPPLQGKQLNISKVLVNA